MIQHIFLIALLSLSLISSKACANLEDDVKPIPVPLTAKDYFELGQQHLSVQEAGQGIDDYTHAIELDPQYAEAYNARGESYRIRGWYEQSVEDIDRAMADFNRAIELNPQYAEAFVNRGLIYQQQKKYGQAIDEFNYAIKLKPDLDYAYLFRGDVYYKLGQYDQAIADYTEVIKLLEDSNSPYAFVIASDYIRRGDAYFQQRKFEEAIADYSYAIDLDPNNIDAYLGRGNTYFIQNQYDEAIADYSHYDIEAYSKSPKFSEVIVALKDHKYSAALTVLCTRNSKSFNPHELELMTLLESQLGKQCPSND